MAESAVEPAAESTVPDPFAALERAATHLASSSVKERISVFDASLASAVANEDFPLDEKAGEFVALIFRTLPLYDDRKSQAAVDRVLFDAINREPAFVKAFAGTLVQTVEKNHNSIGNRGRFRLLQWISLLIRTSPDIAKAKGAFLRLAGALAVLLTDLLRGGERLWRVAERHFKMLPVEVPASVPVFLEVVGGDKAPTGVLGLVLALLDYAQSKEALLEEKKALFLDLYVKTVLSSKDKPAPFFSQAFRPLLKRLSHDDFTSSILPTAVRMLRRSPEVVIEAIRDLVESVSLDLSKHALELLPPLLQHVRHADESFRTSAADVVRGLAAQSSDLDVVEKMFEAAKALLGGSEGKLPNWYQRAGVVTAVNALVAAPGSTKSVAPLAAKVSNYLMTFYKSEGNEDVRLIVLSTLGGWLARSGASMPADAGAFFSAGLKEKETLRRAHLRALRKATTSSDVNEKLLLLADPLLALVKGAVAKAAQRLEGIYSMLLLCRFSSLDAALEDKIVKEKAWTSVLQKDSPFISSTLVSKLSTEDTLALADLLGSIVLHHQSRVAQSADGAQELYKTLVLLLVHPAWDVRRTVTATIARTHASSTSIAEPLLDGFVAWLPVFEHRLKASSEPAESTDKSTDKSSDKTVDSAAPPPGLLAKALIAISSPALVSSPEKSCELFVAAHHPVVARGRRKGSVWRALSRGLKKQGGDVNALMASNAETLTQVLLGPHGLTSRRYSNSRAAVAGLATAMQIFPGDFFPHLFSALEKLGDRNLHDALTERDVKIFNTPDGILSTEEGLYKAEVVQDKNRRGARGRFKMYDDDDDEDTSSKKPESKPAVRPSLATGKKERPGQKAEKKTAKEEFREQQLKEEAEIRARLQQIQETLSLELEALGTAAIANRDFAHDHLPQLVEEVRPLLRNPLVDGDAYDTTSQLAQCVYPPLRYLSYDIATALRLVTTDPAHVVGQLASGPAKKGKQEQSTVERVTAGLVAATQEGPLPTPTFGFVWPVLEQVLLADKKTKLHDDLLAVFALHVAPVMDLPRHRMIAALYQVLGCVPVYHDKVVPLLRQLCQGLEEDEVFGALTGITSQHAHVRHACLDSLASIPSLASSSVPPSDDIACTLWLAMHDPVEANAKAAEDVWDLYNHDLGGGYAPKLTAHLTSPHGSVRQAAASAVAGAMDEYQATVPETLSSLFALFIRESPVGRVAPGGDTRWYGREGVALTLKEGADVLTNRDLPVVATFLISRALADPNPDVRDRMVDAGCAIINEHGADNVALLLPIFENYLDRKSADEERYDLVREGVVIFMGALAKHLSPDSPKISDIVERMLEVLNTPSEAVQRAVSNCLAPLMKSQQANAPALVTRLLDRLLKSDKYAERRGAAFGLAGLVKGLGISSLRQYAIMDTLKAGVEDKSPRTREGALFGFEALCEKLGRLFEPYVIHILPLLLVCFSDPIVAVREATDNAARAIMGQLSGQGVKLVLPALMKGLDDKAWRTKQGSVQLLGAMAYCAPKQLSSCLPTVVPKLSEVLTDTHPKVQAAAQRALQEVGSVIKNPEIAALVPTILVAVADPNEHTKTALEILLQTTFVNSVDAPSLALLVPIVHRGLRERSTDTKKKAAQIVGNMCSLVNEQKDMIPYLELLLPELKKVLLDPIPEVRTVAARALGSLIRGMGEDRFRDLVPWLLETLKSENSSVERSGGAQGLSEVLAALGTDYFERLLPDIITNCSHARPYVRDGYITLFKFLPGAIGAKFENHLGKVLPAILDGLADENETVRDAAMSAGRVLVDSFAKTSLPLLLPAIEEGIFNDSWRIRQSSVELLGDLLFKVAGTSGKVQLSGGSDDEGASTEAHGRAIIEVLGREKRNEVLAAVYMVRSDVSLSVRQAALHVWKTVVVNTPRTLKEIMPLLMRTLILSLASASSERRQVAGRSLGELVRKLGERVLPSIIPILRKGLEDDNWVTRQGVCMGLSEVVASAGRHQLTAHMSELVPAVRIALCDSSPEVQEAAGQAFSALYKNAGMLVVDEIVPALLKDLEEESGSASALGGLKQILSVRTAVVLPHVLPKLVKPPMTAFNAHALGALAEVAGPGLANHLGTILPSLVEGMGAIEDAELASATSKAAQTVALSVDADGLDALMSEVLRLLGDPSAAVRRGACGLLAFFAKNTKLDLEDHTDALLTTLIVMLTDPDEATVKAAWEALGAVTGTVPKESMPTYIKIVRDAVDSARTVERRKLKGKGGPILVPGFCLPKALTPVLQVFLQGLMSGSAELREQAADGLGELIDVTSDAALKPFVVPITGPLIRIIGDRFPWQVKSAILGTLDIVITKGGVSLKPFLPQLQTTFVKCLNDGARTVRSRAARALGRLMGMNPKVDPLVIDLISSVQASEGGVKEATLSALRGVLKHAGKSVSAGAYAKVVPPLRELLGAEEDEFRGLAARTLGALSDHCPDSEYEDLLQSLSATSAAASSQPWTLRHGTTLALASLLRHSAARVAAAPARLQAVLATVKRRAADDKVPVKVAAGKCAGRLLAHQVQAGGATSLQELLPVVATLLTDEASDVRKQALASLKTIAKANVTSLAPFTALVVPPMAKCIQDGNTPVRMAAERCALHVLQLTKGSDSAVQVAQKYMSGLDARRISKMADTSDVSDSEADVADD